MTRMTWMAWMTWSACGIDRAPQDFLQRPRRIRGKTAYLSREGAHPRPPRRAAVLPPNEAFLSSPVPPIAQACDGGIFVGPQAQLPDVGHEHTLPNPSDCLSVIPTLPASSEGKEAEPSQTWAALRLYRVASRGERALCCMRWLSRRLESQRHSGESLAQFRLQEHNIGGTS